MSLCREQTFLYSYSQLFPQSFDFIIFLLELLLKLGTSSIHLSLQQQRVVGYSSLTYRVFLMCELFVICSSPFHIKYYKMVEQQHCICNISVAPYVELSNYRYI